MMYVPSVVWYFLVLRKPCLARSLAPCSGSRQKARETNVNRMGTLDPLPVLGGFGHFDFLQQ